MISFISFEFKILLLMRKGLVLFVVQRSSFEKCNKIDETHSGHELYRRMTIYRVSLIQALKPRSSEQLELQRR